jgi:ribosomal protein L44E
MAIPTTTALELECANCGFADVYPISVFFFNTHQSVAVTCNCGTNLLSLNAKEHKRFCLQVQCPFCEQPHIFLLNRSQVWARKVLPLYCRTTGQEIGRLGPKPEISAESNLNIKESPASNRRPQGLLLPAFLEHSPVLYDMIDQISRLAEESKIDCHCQQQDLEVEIFPDRIRLYCNSCGAFKVVSIRTDGEAKILPDYDRLRLRRVDSGGSWADVTGRSTQKRNKRNI